MSSTRTTVSVDVGEQPPLDGVLPVAVGGFAHERYEPDRPLGEGGFGEVFRAYDRSRREPVAIKRLLTMSASALARFKQEFRALSQLHHPNLVGLRELFEHDGSWYLVMDLVEGDDLMSWVRSETSQRPDLTRVRGALQSLARGLSVLHDANLLHLDVKPANVVVQPNGEAVLLDFGLITRAGEQARKAIGTVAYMAPEQAAGQPLTPAADYYALGACLYEALTGQLPFVGSASEVNRAKRTALPPTPREANGEVLDDALEALTMALLAPAVGARAGAVQVSAYLQRALPRGPDRPSSLAAPTLGVPFAGRQQELADLDAAFERSRAGELTMVVIEGESGIGKTELAMEHGRRICRQHPDALVLRSRCYENELTAFKAFDGLMQELGEALGELPDEQCAAMLPPRAKLLTKLFPVLHGLAPLVQQAVTWIEDADPVAQRLQAMHAMVLLLGRVQAQRPVVLIIDDLQWADPESFRLLRGLVEDADRPPLFVIGTCRSGEELDPATQRSLDMLRGWPCTRHLTLQGLARDETRELIGQLLVAQAPQNWVAQVVNESEGHPLFLSELVRFAERSSGATLADMTVDAAIAARVAALDPTSRKLLELAALCERPRGGEVLALALNSPVEELPASLTTLLSAQLLRRRLAQQVSCFHDRIRRVVTAGLDESTRREHHARLARALRDQPEHESAEVARHLEQSGQRQAAAHAWAAAAREADRSLAFLRAEQCYARAIELDEGRDPAELVRLYRGRIDVLRAVGRFAEAGALCEQVAEGAPLEVRTEFNAIATFTLFAAGLPEQAEQRRTQVLADLGIDAPSSAAGELWATVRERVRLRWRGLAPHRPTSPPDAADRQYLHVLSLIAAGDMDATRFLVPTIYHRLALDAGEPLHAARALISESMVRAFRHPTRPKLYEPHLEEAATLAPSADDPGIVAEVHSGWAMTYMFRGRYQEMEREYARAEHILRTQCPRDATRLTGVRVGLARAWTTRNPHKLIEDGDTWMLEASERGNVGDAARLHFSGKLAVRHIIRDDLERADAEAAELLEPARRCCGPLDMLHTQHMLALYAGGDRALRELDLSSDAPQYSTAERRHAKDFLALMRVQALVCSALAGAGNRQEQLAEAKGLARWIAKTRVPTTAVGGVGALGTLAYLEGDMDTAVRQHTRCRRIYADHGLLSNATAEDFVLGNLLGGEAGKAQADAAVAWFAEQGWQQPLRAMRIFGPAMLQSD